jgi:hypothetical protein
MPLSRQTLEKRAVKAGVKASKKLDHVVTAEELLALRVQTMPAVLRILLVLGGALLIAAAWFAWPFDSNAAQALEVVTGIFAILFGAFGIRRTLSHVLDSVDGIDLAGSILEMIAEAVSNIDL